MIQKKLPTVYEAAIEIYEHASKPGSSKMKAVVNHYSNALVAQWIRSFESKHVLSLPTVKKKLHKYIKNYHNNVYIKSHCATAKKDRKDAPPKESIRRLNDA